jgi:hypothetical protein
MLPAAPGLDLDIQTALSLSYVSADPAAPVVLISFYRRPPPSDFAALHLRHCVFLI